MRWSRVDSDCFGGVASRHRRLLALRVLLALLAPAALLASLHPCFGSAPDSRSLLGPSAEALLVTAGGESLLSYAIGCALPSGAQVSAEDGSHFKGALGLAPQWTDRALAPAERRWLSACLLARTNLFGTHVVISMRGERPSLSGSVTREEERDYPLEEGAFFGDLWRQPSRAYVCVGSGNEAALDRVKRVCTESSDVAGLSRCGFEIAGRCEDVCEHRGSDGAHRRCRGGDTTYKEVITTFLKTE